VESLESEQWGRERSGVYHSFSRAQAGFFHFTIYSARIGLLAQANRNWSWTLANTLANTHWRKLAFSLVWAGYRGSVECWGPRKL